MIFEILIHYFLDHSAQIQAKGNNIVEATIKIVNNGSYSFTLEGGTVLNITVYVAPCAQCQQIAHTVPQQQSKTDHDVSLGSATSGECAHTVQSFHHESTSPITIEQVREDTLRVYGGINYFNFGLCMPNQRSKDL